MSAVSFDPALDELNAEMRRHYLIAGLAGDDGSCLCGWTPRPGQRYPRRALGLHLRAVERRADKRFDAHVGELLDADRARRARP